MRRIKTLAAAVIGLVVLVLLGSLALIESGEVVVIHTRDSEGDTHAARIWVLDHEGRQWVAPGNRSNKWFQRLLVDPKIERVRSGVRACYIATVVEAPDAIPVLERFLEKYAAVMRATAILNFLIEPSGDETPPVAVRLDPC